MVKTIRSNVGPLTYMTFDNDLNVTSPYTENFLIGGSVFDACIALDGTAYTDETTEAGDLTTDDMTLAPAVPEADDAYYFGATKQFHEMAIELSISASTSTWTLAMEYWDGTDWVAVTSLTDNSSQFENAAGIYHLYWTAPVGWKTTTVNDQGPFYYVRYRVSAFTSISAQPFGRQARYYIEKTDWKINGLELTFDAASIAKIQPYIHSVNGRSYDFMLDETTLVSNVSYMLQDGPDCKFRDHFSITITETTGKHVYGNLCIEEIAPGEY